MSAAEATVEAKAKLEALAARVASLLPCRRDPEHFHMERHEIVGEMRHLARRLGRAGA